MNAESPPVPSDSASVGAWRHGRRGAVALLRLGRSRMVFNLPESDGGMYGVFPTSATFAR